MIMTILFPIMIVLCDEFKFPKKNSNRITYFRNHYKKCKKCDITNNNQLEFSTILYDDNTDIDIYITPNDDIEIQILILIKY